MFGVQITPMPLLHPRLRDVTSGGASGGGGAGNEGGNDERHCAEFDLTPAEHTPSKIPNTRPLFLTLAKPNAKGRHYFVLPHGGNILISNKSRKLSSIGVHTFSRLIL